MLTDRPSEIEASDCIILPGVGAFSDGIRKIREKKLDEVLGEEVLEKGKPFLGICIGMQLLASKGVEGGEFDGLGWVDGTVKRLEPNGPSDRIPHMGWNEVDYQKPSPLFEHIPSGKAFYFANSYHFVCNNEENVLAYTPYCGRFVSAISKGNILGVQFHPEKSQGCGLQLLDNFLNFRP